MIFDANGYNSGSDLSAVAESPYALGLEGALMHVYETECNYNAMMKSVGLSELKYYSETGKQLFVNEAGAFGGFIEKAKALFKKIIEKIKAIFKKFMAMINSYAASDKDFVRKYEKDVLRKDVTDMEFTGYEKLKNGYTDPQLSVTVIESITSNVDKVDAYVEKIVKKNEGKDSSPLPDSDDIQDKIEQHRAALIGASGSFTEEEFRDELREKLYGDKETFDVDSSMVRAALATIKDSSKLIKSIDKKQQEITKAIEKYIKALDKAVDSFNKGFNRDIKDKTDDQTKGANNATKIINQNIDMQKATCNDVTIAFGMCSQAAKDANRQAKALCVKVLGYNKKESAGYSESSVDDLFANVKLV